MGNQSCLRFPSCEEFLGSACRPISHRKRPHKLLGAQIFKEQVEHLVSTEGGHYTDLKTFVNTFFLIRPGRFCLPFCSPFHQKRGAHYTRPTPLVNRHRHIFFINSLKRARSAVFRLETPQRRLWARSSCGRPRARHPCVPRPGLSFASLRKCSPRALHPRVNWRLDNRPRPWRALYP